MGDDEDARLDAEARRKLRDRVLEAVRGRARDVQRVAEREDERLRVGIHPFLRK